MRRKAAIGGIIVLLLVVFIFNVKISEAADTYFIDEWGKLQVVVGCDFTLQVKGKAENPIWQSSDEEIVTVNESGEATPVEVGSAKITAQMGNKKYDILIEVFESDKNRVGKKIGAEQPKAPIYSVPLGGVSISGKTWGKKNVRMEVVRVSPNGIKLKFTNKGNKYYTYTEVFRLKKWENGKWRKVKFKERAAFSKGLNVLKISGSDIKRVKWRQYFDDSLAKGKYKIGWQTMGGKVFKSVVFRIE
ncbi:MAG: hypothetical protein NC293_10190 [Roseburia sp.]|nr:hypothetical protein [Roseburia sp.]